MSPQRPSISGQQCVRALTRGGFEFVSQRGSHVKLRNTTSGRRCVVPMHSDLAVGTLASIIRQAGLTPDEFFHLVDPKAFPLTSRVAPDDR